MSRRGADIKGEVFRFLDSYKIEKGEVLTVGVSGGADSVCLLSLLSDYARSRGARVCAVHINHSIRGAEADSDEDFVRELTKSLGGGVTFISFKEDVPAYARKAGKSLEEAGRELRYRRFSETCAREGSKKLFVAHNLGDQAETMLLNMARGSSLDGLAGIRAESVLKEDRSIRVLRPLLNVERRQIEDYLTENNISWREDSTNAGDEYARNRIRHVMIPELEIVNSKAVLHMEELRRDICEAAEWLDREADKLYESFKEDDGLRLEGFDKMPGVMKKRLCYRYICEAAGRRKDIGRVHVTELTELAKKQTGSFADLPYGLRAEKCYDRIVIKKRELNDIKHSEQEIPLDKNNETAGLYVRMIRAGDEDFDTCLRTNSKRLVADLDKLKKSIGNAPLILRLHRDGDWFSPFVNGGRKSVSRFFIDKKLTQEQRNETLLLAAGDHVIWIVGLRSDESFHIDENTKNMLVIERMEKNE